MQPQNILQGDTILVNKPSVKTRAIMVLIVLFSASFLTSCAVWVSGPRYHDNGHGGFAHRGDYYGHDRR
jgi:hypothetical protein